MNERLEWNTGERLGRESQHKTLVLLPCPGLAWAWLGWTVLPSDTTQGTRGAGTFLVVGKSTGVARTRRSGTGEEGEGEHHSGFGGTKKIDD
jgi:hypothetical protein